MSQPSGLELVIDFDHGSIGVRVDNILTEVRDVVSQLSPALQGAFGWLPGSGDAAAEVQVDLTSGTVGADVTVTGDQGEALASAGVLFSPAAAGDQVAVAVSLDRSLDLGSTPLFGPILSGVHIGDLDASYASSATSAGQVHLFDGTLVPPVDVAAGFGLSLSVIAAGSTQTLHLTSSADPSSGDPSGGSPRATPDVEGNTADAMSPAAHALATPGTAAPSTVWFSVNKALGPLTVEKIGVSVGADTVALSLSASLTTEVLSIDLTGFVITVPKSSGSGQTVSVDLEGLAVDLSTATVQIAGSLARIPIAGGVEYDGSLVIKLAKYAIEAAGSYAVIGGTPSLFVFGMAQGEFGGPPMFFVTGLAAGFGLNRSLRLPAAGAVQTFPLIQAATQGAGYLPESGVAGAQDALAKLAADGWVPPDPGEYWVAAGVAFRSFEVVNGFALLTVQFGRELCIALLGIAALKLPTPTDAGPAFAYAEVTLEAVLEPSAGTFTLTVLLSPNSYVIAPDCHLTGGLAMYLWFGANPHAGDFVFTLGGYHPQFIKPDWYPSVPRLGLQWKLGDSVAVSGETYFAVTPACAMGGGRLALTFAFGGLKAWLTAQADFIMYWRPFWFDIAVSVSIGVSYTVSLAFVTATFSVNLGVSIELWGPPLRGVAHVDWAVISFDIPINGGGSPTSGANTLADWPAFALASLPPAGGPGANAMAVGSTTPGSSAAVCAIRADSALLGMIGDGSGGSVWLANGDVLSFSTETVIPSSVVAVNGAASTLTLTGQPVYVYPLGNAAVTSTHQVTLAPWTGADWRPGTTMPTGIDFTGWTWNTVAGSVPAALWGPRGDDAQPALGSAVVPAVVGATATAPTALVTTALNAVASALAMDDLPPRALVLGTTPSSVTGPAPAGDTRTQLATTIVDPSVVTLRTDIVAAMIGCGLVVGAVPGALTLLAADVDDVFTAEPMIGPLGSSGPPAVAPAISSPDHPAATARAATVAEAGTGNATRATATLRALVRQDLPAAPAPVGTKPRRGRVVRHDRRPAVGGSTGPTSPGVPGTTLWPGWTSVWDIGVDGSVLGVDGGPVLLVALDPGRRTLDFRSVESGTTTVMTPNTQRVSISHGTISSPTAGSALGWTARSRMHQVAGSVFVGDGVLIRCQSPVANGPRRSVRTVGVTPARDVIRRNLTAGADAVCRAGWVETWWPTGAATATAGIVDVTLRSAPGDSAQAGLEPTVTQGGRVLRSIDRAASYRWDGARLWTWTYALGATAVDRPDGVRVQASPGRPVESTYLRARSDDRVAARDLRNANGSHDSDRAGIGPRPVEVVWQ